ncbi:MAG TPA: hypothetical protein VJP79_00220 [Nitrososphaera sp.]|nr:hypothetical protein [Nitrososphaera sp.]
MRAAVIVAGLAILLLGAMLDFLIFFSVAASGGSAAANGFRAEMFLIPGSITTVGVVIVVYGIVAKTRYP